MSIESSLEIIIVCLTVVIVIRTVQLTSALKAIQDMVDQISSDVDSLTESEKKYGKK